ncbi:family 10 glycosylhydrolase [Paenibacillus beijingensis]|uniref:Glycosyl hydrolase-like 10 domain-containing protein n=1 Tax=Paenibacillus beijingensis TaxID=1126833 RepID=A0A0D5NHB4_9BACL|nr:family 10 glycosylhydrolase [Paenibacillus beijingensis]AJY74308.1 hypothetical protein VN24_06590 [Paenibacillus beijingensis]
MPLHNQIEKGANVLWVDFLANGAHLADPSEQEALVSRAKESGVTHLVVDAKIPHGHTTYPSRYALHVSEWSDGRYQAWEGRDFMAEILREARSAGLKVLANVDVFMEGSKKSGEGIAFQKKDWEVVYIKPESSGLSAYAEGEDNDAVFVNPIHPEVVEHELSILREIVSGYGVDGIVLDRCRYPNIHADFSDRSREGFERYINQTVERWPYDILEPVAGGGRGISGKENGFQNGRNGARSTSRNSCRKRKRRSNRFATSACLAFTSVPGIRSITRKE